MMNKTIRKTIASGDVISGSPDAGVAKLLDTAGDILVVDVRELTNMTVQVNQLVDNGTCTINVEGTNDGTNWALIGTALTEASFPAGANTAAAVGVSDARGMALQFLEIRARLVATTGTGTYTMCVAGLLLPENR